VSVLRGANLGLRFVLELSAIAAVAYWGWTTGDGALAWVLALGAALAVVAVWALFVSPKAKVEVARPAGLAIELAVWLAAGAALYASGHPLLAVAFAVVAVASGSLNYAWSDERERPG
jgi:hypothetical protein